MAFQDTLTMVWPLEPLQEKAVRADWRLAAGDLRWPGVQTRPAGTVGDPEA